MADDPVTGQERTLPPSPRRREEARKRGEVAISREVNSALVLLAGLAALYYLGGQLWNGMALSIAYFFEEAASWEPEMENISSLAINTVYQFFVIQWPVLAVVVAVGIFANIAQVGVNFTFEVLQPRWERLNPLSGIKRIFSKRGLVELFKSLFKLAILSWVSYLVIRDHTAAINALMDTDIGPILKLTVAIGFEIGLKTALILLILAILDYGFQRYTHEQGLMMSPAEARQEQKQYEGDPQIKARIRSVQREMARRRMMEAVPTAEVVVTNPTEYAIALAYEQGMAAPTVVARGRHFLAQRIRDIAEEHDVPIIEDPPLAQALFRACQVGDVIPQSLYQAVAGVLAYVYKLRGRTGPRPAATG